MGRLTIAGLIAALTFGTFVVVAAAQVKPVPGVTRAPPTPEPAPFWPSTEGQTSVVGEWYSDIPWHQKLGTFSGNQLDEAIVLPYEALTASDSPLGKNAGANYTSDRTPEGRCMIEIGINSILGTYRTDTPYDPKYPNTKTMGKCQSNLQPPPTMHRSQVATIYVLDPEHG